MGAYVWIGIGGALGTMARHWCNGAFLRFFGANWTGTLVINIVGSLVIGLASSLMSNDGRFPSTPMAQVFVMTGICGGYTTFSAFSLQTLGLMQGNQWMAAGANVVLSVVLCMIAVWLGHTAGTLVNPA